jgi:AcrR family transcriptional regulator
MARVDDKRAAILTATLRLISQNGFHGTAMSKVAKEAGVSAGIIYHYFDSKDELIDELYKEIKRNLGASLAESADQHQPLRTQIHRMLGGMIRYFIRRPLESAFLEQYSRSPYHRPEIDLETAQYYLPLIEIFQRAQQEMIIKALPEPVVMAFTLEVATSLAQRHASGFLDLTDDLIEEVIEASWEAIRQ